MQKNTFRSGVELWNVITLSVKLFKEGAAGVNYILYYSEIKGE